MRKDIKKYIQTCDTCQRTKPTNQHPSGLLQPLSTPARRWEEITMDFIVQLPLTKQGHDAIVVFVDRLTKRAHFQPIHISATALKLPRSFLPPYSSCMYCHVLLFLIEMSYLPVTSGKHYLSNWEPKLPCQQPSIHKQMDKQKG